VGKTGAAISLAKMLDTEIISSDSMQIYKGMDIGTAKPSMKERAAVRHHMIDIIDPTEPFSAGQYMERAIPVIDELHIKGRIPLVVGGTGLYIKAITRGIFSGPSADRVLREDLLSMEREKSGSLYEYLKKMDPEAGEKIERHDTRRIVRALEVCLKSNEKISLLQKKFTRPLPCQFIKIGLMRERKELYGIIEGRVDRMIESGLEKEVRNLMKLEPDRTPLQAIGYKEFIAYLKGDIPIDAAILLVKRNTRRYAKRQFTWFRKEEGIRWIDITGIHDDKEVFNSIKMTLREICPDLFEMKKPSKV
jgi:tRNA dimethylallyltransferase